MDDSPVNKRELGELLQAQETRIVDRLTEIVRDDQTEILKAFFAESNQKRLTAAEQESAALKDHLATLESRLTEVEKRLNMPPAA